jgi:uncharacterized protein
MATSAGSDVLRAPHVLEYTYTRSVGPVIGGFFGGLRAGLLLGARTRSGRVVVPPAEYDPDTAEEVGELVEVGPGGVVTTWGWTEHPQKGQPLHRPFAWALIRPDGADTAMLHAVDAGSRESMSSGMRVKPRWLPASERTGKMSDIVCFVPEDTSIDEPSTDGGTLTDGSRKGEGPVTMLETPIRIDYEFTAGLAQSRYLKGIAEGKFLGQRCPKCGKVYVPPRGSCPTDGVPTTDEVVLGNTGTVTTYCVVNVPFQGQSIEIPYICAQILLDGANIAFMGLIQEIPATEVRMGLRVEAVWVDKKDLGPTMASVKYFRPSGEPDAAYESFAEYL